MTNVYGGKIPIVTLADGSVRKLRPEVRLEHPLIFSEHGKNIFIVTYVRNDSQAVKLSFASIDGSPYHAYGLMLPLGGAVSTVVRKSVVLGKRVSVRVEPGGRRSLHK